MTQDNSLPIPPDVPTALSVYAKPKAALSHSRHIESRQCQSIHAGGSQTKTSCVRYVARCVFTYLGGQVGRTNNAETNFFRLEIS